MLMARVLSTSWSRSQAAFRYSRRAASTSTRISAIISCTSWKAPMGRLKAWRSFACWTLASRHAWPMPAAPAATPSRPWFRTCMAISHPWPSAPMRWSAGMRQSSKARSAVGDARRPSFVFVSTWGTVNPGVPFSTRKAQIPSCRVVPGSRPKTTT